MTEGFSGVESALSLSQSKVEFVRHSFAYNFGIPTPLCGQIDVLFILKTYSSWVRLAEKGSLHILLKTRLADEFAILRSGYA
jgi:hypothetical protein